MESYLTTGRQLRRILFHAYFFVHDISLYKMFFSIL